MSRGREPPCSSRCTESKPAPSRRTILQAYRDDPQAEEGASRAGERHANSDRRYQEAREHDHSASQHIHAALRDGEREIQKGPPPASPGRRRWDRDTLKGREVHRPRPPLHARVIERSPHHQHPQAEQQRPRAEAPCDCERIHDGRPADLASL